MLDNATDLCRGKTTSSFHFNFFPMNSNILLSLSHSSGTSSHLTGAPFRPVCGVSVDLFPHTPHAELVVLFERMESNDVEISDPVVSISLSFYFFFFFFFFFFFHFMFYVVGYFSL